MSSSTGLTGLTGLTLNQWPSFGQGFRSHVPVKQNGHRAGANTSLTGGSAGGLSRKNWRLEKRRDAPRIWFFDGFSMFSFEQYIR